MRVESSIHENIELCEELEKVLCHKGFLTAYRSIQPSILQLLRMAIDTCDGNNNCGVDSWTIYITGHSLGGALASLVTFDLSRIANECYQKESEVATSSKHDRILFEKKKRDQSKSLYNQLFSGESWVDPASSTLAGGSERRRSFLRALQHSDLVTYTYGAPRVGNIMFSKLYELPTLIE